jgi:hypothetical protein
VSVLVCFIHGFPLGGGFCVEQFAPARWYETAGEERLLLRTVQLNEALPAEFYCSLEEGVPERVAPEVFGFPQRREFPGEQTVWCLLQRYLFEIRRSTSGNRFFAPAVFSSRRAPWGGNCSAGNPPPRENPRLKRTRTDAILKKF